SAAQTSEAQLANSSVRAAHCGRTYGKSIWHIQGGIRKQGDIWPKSSSRLYGRVCKNSIWHITVPSLSREVKPYQQRYHTVGRTSMLKTSLALSNLRGFTILMVVAFHSCIAYLGSQPPLALPFNTPPYGWMSNPIIDSERWFGLDLFCAFTYVYLMHLMFFLSGLFVWPSLLRKGGMTFLYDRCVRLGAPFAVGVCLLMPVAYYPVYR